MQDFILILAENTWYLILNMVSFHVVYWQIMYNIWPTKAREGNWAFTEIAILCRHVFYSSRKQPNLCFASLPASHSQCPESWEGCIRQLHHWIMTDHTSQWSTSLAFSLANNWLLWATCLVALNLTFIYIGSFPYNSLNWSTIN